MHLRRNRSGVTDNGNKIGRYSRAHVTQNEDTKLDQCPVLTASSCPRRSAGRRKWSRLVRRQDRRTLASHSEGPLTFKCLNCQAQVANNATICITLYHTALPFVASLKSLKSASLSLWYCCSLLISSNFKFSSRTLLAISEMCERSCSTSGFAAPTTISR